MKFEYTVIQESMPAWEPYAQEGEAPTWRLTGGTRTTEYVDNASVRWVEDPSYGRLIEVLTTADGPILAMMAEPHTEYLTFRHPAMVQYASGRLQLKPIFGAERELKLYRHAIHAVSAPSEVLLASYPYYLMQSNMGGFLQKLPAPLHTHEEDVTLRCT